MTTAKLAILPPLALLGSLLLSGCGTGEASVVEAPTEATPVPVEIASPVRADIFATFEATATIASDADAPIVARVGGEVVELLVEEGQYVEKGQILARLDGERLRLEMLAARANLERARKELERNRDLSARGLISASMFDGLQYELEALEATYELARLNFGYTRIRATIPGIVSARDIKPGENLAPGQTAFRITDTNELVAYLQIPQAELGKFAVGHAAFIDVASMPGESFAARIARISPTIDTRNGTFRATAIIDNAGGLLAPGMFGHFTIAYEKHADALVIPEIALLDEDERATVYVVEDGKVSRRTVETGINSGGRIEILSGLDVDEQIVIVGHSALRDGTKVLASSANRDSYSG